MIFFRRREANESGCQRDCIGQFGLADQAQIRMLGQADSENPVEESLYRTGDRQYRRTLLGCRPKQGCCLQRREGKEERVREQAKGVGSIGREPQKSTK